MNTKARILPVLFFLIPNLILAQGFELNLKSMDSIENSILQNIDYKQEHININSLENEIKSVSQKIKKKGFFLNTVDSIIQIENRKTVFLRLNKKVNILAIAINSSLFLKQKKHIKIEKTAAFLDSISFDQEKKGYLFSQTKLTNLKIREDTLYASIKTKKSKKRRVDKIIIKGYPEISKKKMYRFLDIKNKDIINNNKLEEISTNIENLNFVSSIKKPEILFKKDSTLLYLYLKKETKSNFDGIMNFSSKEDDDGFLFTGHLNLNLHNTFNKGEDLEFLWEANGEKTQNLSISTFIPYLFNSSIATKFKFKLHKQDSTFISNIISTVIHYNISPKSHLGITYDSENSKNTLINSDDNYSDFNNNFIGISFLYKRNKAFKLYINPSFGKRNSDDNIENQFKFTSNISYLYEINNKNAISLKNETSVLLSNSELTNELYRIGGANSIRGFDEESIFTSKYSFINLEYHYHTSLQSYFFSISDFGILNTEKLVSFGLGYSFLSKKNQIKISTVVGKKRNNSINLDNSKIIINFTAFF